MALNGFGHVSRPPRAVLDRIVANATEHYRIGVGKNLLLPIRAVVVVIQFRTPLKVVGTIVARVLVLVVHLRKRIWIGYECQCDKAMDCHALALSAERKVNRWVNNTSMHGLDNLEARAVASRKDTGYAPNAADFV
jgi:hypothetical protein